MPEPNSAAVVEPSSSKITDTTMTAALPPFKALFLAWGIFATFAAFSLGKPLTLDQASPVAFNAGAIAKHGFAELGSSTVHYEVAHPTLYHHLLAFFFKLLGETNLAARLPGLVCFLATSFLLLLLSLRLFEDEERGKSVAAVAVLVYGSAPFVIQHSLIVDQSTTLLPPFMLLFVYFLYHFEFRLTWKSLWALGVAFALCIWAHESIPFLLILALGLYLWFARGVGASLVMCAAISILGVALFAVTWLVYCHLTGVRVFAFVEISVLNKLLNPAHGGSLSLKVIAWRTWTKLRWLSVPVLLMVALAARERVGELFRRNVSVRTRDFLWCWLAVVVAVTSVYWTEQSRYQFSAYAAASLIVGETVVKWADRMGWLKVVSAGVVGVGLALAMAALYADPLMMVKPAEYAVYVMVVPAAAAAVALALMKVPVWRGRESVLLVLSVMVAVCLWTNVEQTARYTTSVSWWEYGEVGFEETLAYLEERVGDSVPVIRKDFAYALLRERPDRSLEWINNRSFRRGIWESGESRKVEESLGRHDVRIVLTDDRLANHPTALELLRRDFNLIRTFGDFQIFEKRARPRKAELSA